MWLVTFYWCTYFWHLYTKIHVFMDNIRMICIFICIYSVHVLWNTLLLHVFYDHCYIVYEGFFSVKVQYMGSPFHLQASKVLSHLFTMSLHWTARYGRPPCQFRPHPDSTPVGQNCCRTLIIVFWNVLSNFKEVIHLCIRSKAFVTGAIFCQQNLRIWGSFRE